MAQIGTIGDTYDNAAPRPSWGLCMVISTPSAERAEALGA